MNSVLLFSDDSRLETEWKNLELGSLNVRRVSFESIQNVTGSEKLWIIDVRDNSPLVYEWISTINRKGKVILLLVSEGSQVPELLMSAMADDLLVHPFRFLDVYSRLWQVARILNWQEVEGLNESISAMVARLQEDVKVAERIQAATVPGRFGNLKGFDVKSRYLAGMRSGGDFFDLAETGHGEFLSVILTDSSSYGLSSSVLKVIMKVMMGLSRESVGSSQDTVNALSEQIQFTLGEKDHLSIFHAVISKKDLSVDYVNLGTSGAWHFKKDGTAVELPHQGPALSHKEMKFKSGKFKLQPQDRLVLVSDGFLHSLGGKSTVKELIAGHRNAEADSLLTEMVYRVKSKLVVDEGETDMPEQDCSVVALEVKKNVLRRVS